MSLEETLARRAFQLARNSLACLRTPQTDGSVALNRFAEVEQVRFASGTGVVDVRPKSRSTNWTTFCEGVAAYAHTVVGPTEDDKRARSKYVIAGEVVTSVTVVDGGLLSGPSLDSHRKDVDVRSQTMLVLDCDSPVASAPLCRALEELSLAYCVAPTWASTVESPRWRCFLPIGVLAVNPSEAGRWQARVRYAWLAGLLTELAGLPVECPTCGGEGKVAAVGAAPGVVCPSCLGDGTFRFDLSCWNYSRLHFLGGRQSADQDMDTRTVRWARGYGIDCAAWLEGSEFPAFWAEALAELEASRVVRTASHSAVGGGGDGHPDAEIASAVADCAIGLLERVRRAALYVGSPDFPASCKAHHDPRYGHGDLMRAASAVCSGFLVPLEFADEEWALRVLEVAYNPRCKDLEGEPHPWTAREMKRKLAEVRASQGANAPGYLLERPSQEGNAFYVVRSDGSQGQAADAAGVYTSRGEQLPSATRSGALLELSVDAARACVLRPFDPYSLPEGFKARKTVLAAEPVRVMVVGTEVGRVQVAGSGGGLVSGGLGGGSLRVLAGGLSSGGLEGSGGGRGRARIPFDSDWHETVVIDADDEAARRAIVEQMNQRLAYVQLPRDAVIVDTAANKARGRGERAFMTLRGFLADQQRYPLALRTFNSKSGGEKRREVNRADLWLSSPHRRQYAEWGFAPEKSAADCEAIDPATGSRRLLNTFQGFPVRAANTGLRDCPRFAELVNEVIADGSEDLARYLWVWFADLFQRPADKPGVALYIYSPEKGTGKGTLLSVMGLLLGRYYQFAQSADHVAGQWNLHLADKLLVFFDEARGLEGRDKADKLNSLITESVFAASEKFMPLQNCPSYARYAFASNREDGVSIQVQDRRFAAFKVSPKRCRDVEFFKALWSELFAPCAAPARPALDLERAAAGVYKGFSGLMGHLLYGVKTGGEGRAVAGQPQTGGAVELRSIPSTELRVKMMLSSLEGVEAFVFASSCQSQQLGYTWREGPTGRAEPVGVAWMQGAAFAVLASEFTVMYNDWARVHKQPAVDGQIRRQLEAVFTVVTVRDGKEERTRHPDFRVDQVESDSGKRRVYWLPPGPSVYGWLARKYGW